jgi:5-methylcytosine-specific restriction endonuclease McrA
MKNPTVEQKKRWQRTYYEKNRAKWRAACQTQRESLRQEIAKAKKAGCSRCPEHHPACLDFHHLDPTGKDLSVGNAISSEIAKCVLLCSNCHRKLHAPVDER